jgi:hypothetical protein
MCRRAKILIRRKKERERENDRQKCGCACRRADVWAGGSAAIQKERKKERANNKNLGNAG